ncbi:hypothetical protein GCM10022420_094850 [Streptomyces iranensis]
MAGQSGADTAGGRIVQRYGAGRAENCRAHVTPVAGQSYVVRLVLVSHSHTLAEDPLPEARVRPSGAKASGSRLPVSERVVRVRPDRPVIAARGQGVSIPAECHVDHGLASKGAAGPHVPQPGGAVLDGPTLTFDHQKGASLSAADTT